MTRLDAVELLDFIDAAAGEDDKSPAQGDDEDLRDDPVSLLDLRVCRLRLSCPHGAS